ncbi:MAG: hypothetical protein IKJ39_01695 [Lachnospiraceae bacterium]|nr:hypothetical protein [Lachnospiraceae bacterium]
MLKKDVFFVIMLVWNVVLFFLFGYWQQMNAQMDFGVGLAVGIIAVIVIALGEASVVQQFYLCAKWKAHKIQVFEYRLVRQIVLLVLFHVVGLLIVNHLININGIFYVAAIGIFLSMGWLKGSEILWTLEGTGYYLIANGNVYNVESVTENTKVFELSCTRKGERDRVITIEKKESIDDLSILK